MARIAGFRVYAVDLPFRKPFAHAAAVRSVSESVFIKCLLGDGTAGYGECLPRHYVTGEERGAIVQLLAEKILPGLIGREFGTFEQLWGFLAERNGKPPPQILPEGMSGTAAWAAVDLALLDAVGRALGESAALRPGKDYPEGVRYSVVISANSPGKFIRTALLSRLMGFRQVKIKVGRDGSEGLVRTARKILGRRCDIRIDANMAWSMEEALLLMPRLAAHGVRLFEQPIEAGDIRGLSYLVRATGLGVMADESFHDAETLERLIKERACTAVNVRISKCGGLVASLARCRRARDAGLLVQTGCQVGESSLLSAAQLRLLTQFGEAVYAEGCFGRHLLRVDPVHPQLTFRHGGRPPAIPAGSGLGVEVDEQKLSAFTVASVPVGPAAL